MDEIRDILDELELDEYQTEYGTVERITSPKKAGNKFDRATFEAEFPEIDAAPFGIVHCHDPYSCGMKSAEEVEALLAELEGYSEAQLNRMRELFDIRTMPDRIVVQLRTPGDPPAEWPDDEE